jgi:hypothetical protein
LCNLMGWSSSIMWYNYSRASKKNQFFGTKK